jgi:ADP-ribose pyrophosphatase YjhB (NUDIX family)
LIKEGLIAKSDKGYTLTTKGKEFANRMDTDALVLERQAKLAVALHAIRSVNGHIEYLIHRRLKQPFYGWYGSHSGKIRWGETPLIAAQREFSEETGLSGDFTLKGVIHYHHFHQSGQLLEDKYFWVYKIENLTGDLKVHVPEGENLWMTAKEIKPIKNIFATYNEMAEILNSKTLVYIERPRMVEEY